MSTKSNSKNTSGIAGLKSTSKFVAVTKNDTVDKVKKIIMDKTRELEVIDEVYIVNENNVLEGAVSLKEILQSPDETKIESIMKKNILSVRYHSHQERVIQVALKNDLKAVPVVDKENHLLGVIPHDIILDIFHHEFREDILSSGGIRHKDKEIEKIATPVSRLIKARMPSLIIGLSGGLIAAYIVSGFEEVLRSYLVLAAFMPVMIYLSDAIGTQSQTLIVRMIAMEPKFSLKRYLTREIKIGASLGAIFASLLFIATIFGFGSHIHLAIIIGTSMFVSMLIQTFVATYLSVMLAKSHVDPAIASGPIATIISDITTVIVYFGIATILLENL
ncbi:MAG TPA: magnesium transporter [Nitrosopumilaceae archaeon]|nr:magnesium transporter [Nitrosopumilaceae archaeon]